MLRKIWAFLSRMVPGLLSKETFGEQYHSEIKTDMDVERLPSDKFDTNELVLELIVLAYNILRLIGQESLKRKRVPLFREPFFRFKINIDNKSSGLQEDNSGLRKPTQTITDFIVVYQGFGYCEKHIKSANISRLHTTFFCGTIYYIGFLYAWKPQV